MRFVQSFLLLCLLAVAGQAQTSNLWRPQPNPTPPPCPQIRQFYNVSGSFQQIDCNGVVTSIGSGSSMQDPGANGIVVRTSLNTTVARTLQGTVNRIVVTNGDGVAGPPTLDVGSTVATSGANLSFFSSTTSAQLAGVISDETGSGSLVFNSSPTIVTPTIASFANAAHNHEGAAGGGQLNASNVFSAGMVSLARGGTGSSLADPNAHRLLGWDDSNNDVRFFVIGSGLSYDPDTDTLSTAGGGGLGDPGGNGIVARTALNTTVARTLQQPAAGVTISNANGVGGDPTFALANDLAAVEGLGSAGIAVRAAADTWAVRTLTGTTNRIVITNGNGASDNPTFDIGSDVVTLGATQTLTNKTLVNPRIGTGFPNDLLDNNGNPVLRFLVTGSAVNFLNTTNNVAGQPVFLGVSGSDTNIDLVIDGKGTGRAVIPGYPYTLEVNSTSVGNVGGGLDTLHTYNLAAGSLANNGDYLHIRYTGDFANTEADKQIQITFGGVLLSGFGGVIDIEGGGWTYDIYVVRESATTVRASILANFVNIRKADGALAAAPSGGFVFTQNNLLTVSNLNSNAMAITVLGEGSANNDVVHYQSIIQLVQR
jgi:hypothetical protein